MLVNAHTAQLAAEELRDRQTSARRLIGEGKVTRARALAEIKPFVALACRWGVNLPELRDEIEQLRGVFGADDLALARRLVADDLCPTHGISDALVKARDRAVERALSDPTRQPRATRLAMIAAAFGCPHYRAAAAEPERKAA